MWKYLEIHSDEFTSKTKAVVTGEALFENLLENTKRMSLTDTLCEVNLTTYDFS